MERLARRSRDIFSLSYRAFPPFKTDELTLCVKVCILELLKLVLPLDSRSTLGSQHSAVIPVMQYIHMPWLYILDKSFVLNYFTNLV